MSEFFKLNATYQVAPGGDPDALLDDAACLMSIVSDGLNALAMNIDTSKEASMVSEGGICQLLHGLSYLASMANNAAGAAQAAVRAKEAQS